jgi:hypothetical protein
VLKTVYAYGLRRREAVLASLLGVHIQTRYTRRDWTAYLAERAGTSHQGT